MKIQNSLKKAFGVAALSIGLAFTPMQEAQAQDIEVRFPNGNTTTLDVSLWYRQGNTIYMTKEVIDVLDKAYGGSRLNDPSIKTKAEMMRDPQNAAHTGSINQYLFIEHLASKHKTCIAQAGHYEQSKGINTDAKYGDGWENKTACFLIPVIKGSLDELGIDY